MKDYLRDYATAAFRFYASNDRSAEKYKNKVREEAIKKVEERMSKPSGASSPTEAALIKAEEAVNEKMAEIRDLEAVEKTLAQLTVKHRQDIVQTIEFVYFLNPDKEFCKDNIQERVKAASIEIPASERTIYYWLKQARELFAKERGLRLKSLQ